MKLIECAPGSPEWIAARLGIPTASRFSSILTPAKRQLAAARFRYRNELLAEHFTGEPTDGADSDFMERGRLMEPDAVAYYEFARGIDTKPGGFCVADDGSHGCSPDRLVGDDGGLEIKCPSAAVHVGYLLDGPGADYVCQVQGSLMVTGRAWWDFCSYNPVLPPVLIRFERDGEFIGALREALGTFLGELSEARKRLEGLGAKVPLRMPAREEIPTMEELERALGC